MPPRHWKLLFLKLHSKNNVCEFVWYSAHTCNALNCSCVKLRMHHVMFQGWAYCCRQECFAPTSAVAGGLQVWVREMHWYACFCVFYVRGNYGQFFHIFLTQKPRVTWEILKSINSETKGYYFVAVGRCREIPSPFCLNWGEDVPKLSGNFHRSN